MAGNLDNAVAVAHSASDAPLGSSNDSSTAITTSNQARSSTRLARLPRPDYKEPEFPYIDSPCHSPYVPVDPIVYVADPAQYGSPSRNIVLGEVLTPRIKKEIIALAPHRNRCIITHLAGIDVQFCHLLARATGAEIIQKLEWIAGVLPCRLFVNSRFNVICLKSEIHILADNGGFIFLPSRPVLEALNELTRWNSDRTSWKDRRRYNKEHPALTAKSYTYRMIPVNMPPNRRFSRIQLTKSKDGQWVEAKDVWKDYPMSFEHDDLQKIELHAHPFFICCHALQQIVRLEKVPGKLGDQWMKFFRDLAITDKLFGVLLPMIRFWLNTKKPVPEFFTPDNVPQDLRAAETEEMIENGLADPFLDSPDITNKGKRKKAQSAPAQPKNTLTLRIPDISNAILNCEIHAPPSFFQKCFDSANEAIQKINSTFALHISRRVTRSIFKPPISPSEEQAARRKKFKSDTARHSESGQRGIKRAMSPSSEEDPIASTSAVPLERLGKRGDAGRNSAAGSSRSQISKGKQKATGSTRREDATVSTSAVPFQRLANLSGGGGSTSVAGSYQSKASKGKKKATGY
ncbi:hypothetical protein F5880DRAFT_1704391 [Lentinula raphanica]|nr:hypothetical protein F5880DRAFT_1704391 [Lentinula raphanica]